MRNTVKILGCSLLFASIVQQLQPAQAANIQNCGRLPAVAVEDLRNIRAGHDAGRPYNNAGGHGGTKLPSIGRNQEYREYDVDANNPNAGNRGRYRFVIVVTTENGGKRVYEPIYFTQNHYRSFCKV